MARPSWQSIRRADVAVILLLVSPAVIVPGALNRFVFGKLLIATIGIGIAATVPAVGRLGRVARWLLGSAAAVLALSAALSSSPRTAFLGRAPVYEGVLVLSVYLLAGVCGARLLGPQRSRRTEQIALAAMAVCALAVAVLAVVESFGLRPLSTDLDRPGSLLGSASDEGAFAALYLGPLLARALGTRRALPIAGAAAALLTVVLSASRGAFLGAIAALVVLAFAMRRGDRRLLGGLLAGSVGLVLAVPFARDRLLGLSPLAGHTVTGRSLLWREALGLFGHHPVLGVGPSQFENAIVGQHDLRWQTSIGPQNPPGSPHDIALQALLSGGVLLLLLAVALVVLVVRASVAGMRDDPLQWTAGRAAGLAGYLVALCFHFTSPGTAIPAAVLGGSLLAVPAATARRPAWFAAVAVPVTAALAVLFVMGALAEESLRSGTTAVAAGHYAQADRDFGSARTLRFWDADLPVGALHQFVAAASAGQSAATPYAVRWAARVGPVADDEQVRQNLAALAEVRGDYAGALRLLDAGLARDPHDPQYLLLRGVVRVQVHDYSGAEQDLLHAARVATTDPDPWRDLAILYKLQGKTSAAADATAKADALSASRPRR